MDENMKKDNFITQGPLYKSFIKYFIPIFLGSLIQQSYTFVDAIIIGNFAGKNALAAVDAPYSYIKLLINAFIALSVGGTIVVSQYYGANKKDKLEEIISNLIRLGVIGGIIISIIGVFFAPKFIKIMLIPDEIYDLSLSYLRVYFSGTILVFIFNIASGILRALGDSKNPFYYLMFSSALNIILDIVFVAFLDWSVAGAALATIISQGLAMILILVKIKNLGYHFGKTKNLDSLKKTLRLGSPMALQSVLFSISNLFMQRGINSFGTDSIAGWSICGKSDFIIWSLIDTIGIAVTTFVAQNYGAKKRERMNQTVRLGLLISTAIIGSISIVLYIFIGQIAAIFTRDQSTIENAILLMRFTSPYYILCAFGEAFSGGIKGRGNTFHPMLITLVGTCVFRIVWVQIVTNKFMTLKNIILAYPWSWFITGVLFFIYYFIVVHIRKNKDIEMLENS